MPAPQLPPVHSNTRRLTVTHDGLPLGYTVPLSPDNPFRGRLRQAVALKAIQQKGQAAARARSHAGRRGIIRSAQQRSETRRGQHHG